MRRRTLWLAFAAALPLMLAASFPLRLALDLADAEGAGLSARAATGTVWNGRLHDTRVGGVTLGDAGARLAMLPLLAGTVAVDITTPSIMARLTAGRSAGIARATGSLSLPASALMPGTRTLARTDGLELQFRGGDCIRAGGRVAIAIDRVDGGSLGLLEGSPDCEGRTAVLALATVDAGGPLARLQATARIHADGAWELEARVPVAADPAARAALEALGFQPAPGGWSRLDRGRLH